MVRPDALTADAQLIEARQRALDVARVAQRVYYLDGSDEQWLERLTETFIVLRPLVQGLYCLSMAFNPGR